MALVLFDFDGTLYDSERAVWRTVTYQKRFTPELAVVKDRTTLHAVYQGNFYEQLCRMNHLPLSYAPVLARRMRKCFVKDYTAPLVPGMKSALKQLAVKHHLAVVSSNYKTAMVRLLRRDGVLRYFKEVSGADAGTAKRVREAALMKRLKVSPRNVYYITDTTGDVREARKDGIRSIGVTWGFHSSAMLKKAGVKAVVSRPQQLVKVLNG